MERDGLGAAGKQTPLIASFRARYNPIPELFISFFHISSKWIMQLSILAVVITLLEGHSHCNKTITTTERIININ